MCHSLFFFRSSFHSIFIALIFHSKHMSLRKYPGTWLWTSRNLTNCVIPNSITWIGRFCSRSFILEFLTFNRYITCFHVEWVGHVLHVRRIHWCRKYSTLCATVHLSRYYHAWSQYNDHNDIATESLENNSKSDVSLLVVAQGGRTERKTDIPRENCHLAELNA